jgi:hypothetical protein
MKDKGEKMWPYWQREIKRGLAHFPVSRPRGKMGYEGSLELVWMDEEIATCCKKSLVTSREEPSSLRSYKKEEP